MLLRVQTNDKRWDVNYLFANAIRTVSNNVAIRTMPGLPDVPLTNQDPCVVNTFRKPEFIDTGLQTALQEVLHLQSKHVIEFHAGFVKHAHTHETSNESIAFEKPLGVFFVQSKQLTAKNG